MKPIYFDYAATTPVDPEVAEKMCQYLTLDGCFANPAARSHVFGWQADDAVETARHQVASTLGADAREIIWTSGATESDNLALKGAAAHYAPAGGHIITSMAEHKAVLDTCAYLERRGYEVTYLRPTSAGVIEPEQVAAALTENTFLVSLMHMNNETGAITDVAAVGTLLRAHAGVLFHVDAAQSAGKLVLDVREQAIDLISISAHKIYGPKGVGALYVRRQPEVRLEPLIHGGGHERGMRSGTLPTHQIVGLAQALTLAQARLEQDRAHLDALRAQLLAGVANIEGISVNGDPDRCWPGIVSLAFEGMEGETLLIALNELALSSGSACNSASMAPSYVLTAMGLSDAKALSSLRLSMGRFSTSEEVERALTILGETVSRLRA